jgi:hypothetical protein
MKKAFLLGFALAMGVVSSAHATAEDTNAVLTLKPSNQGIWAQGVGEGFRSSAQTLGIAASASYGVSIFGGSEKHDLSLLDLSYSHMLGKVKGKDRWYRGNWEGRLELFGGSQFDPQPDWAAGISGHFRYDFALGTRLVPFFDAGIGLGGTGISAPDLSGGFEFNLQAGPGAYWFVTDHVALTGEVRLMHMSCAGLKAPNLGLNTILGLVGVSWFF